MPSTEVRDLTPVAPAAVASGDVFAVLDVSASAGSSVIGIAASNLVPAAINAMGGVLKIPQIGGTSGTDEVQISHNGTRARIESREGDIDLIPNADIGQNGLRVVDFGILSSGLRTCALTGASSTTAIWISPGPPVTYIGSDGSGSPNFSIASGNLISPSGGGFSWSSGTNAFSASDTSLRRPAAKVVQLNGQIGFNQSATLSSIPLVVSQITSDQNNYNPGVAFFYNISSDASRSITGLSIGQVDGQMAEFRNTGSNNITFAHESASSTASNRFLFSTGANIVVASNGFIRLRYDATASRWFDR